MRTSYAAVAALPLFCASSAHAAPPPATIETSSAPVEVRVAPLAPSSATYPYPYTPPPFHYERRSIKALWLTGLILDLGVWAIRAAVTAGICASYTGGEKGCSSTDYASAAIPVVGAWIDLSTGSDSTAHGAGAGNSVLLAFSGTLETAGFVLLVVGAIVHHDVAVYDRKGVSLQLAPTSVPGGAGMGIVGRF